MKKTFFKCPVWFCFLSYAGEVAWKFKNEKVKFLIKTEVSQWSNSKSVWTDSKVEIICHDSIGKN